MKIQEICPNTKHVVNGIGTYCHSLARLFEDDEDIDVIPPLLIPTKENSLLNIYANWGDIYRAIKNCGADVIHVNGYTSFLACQAIIVSLLLHKKIIYTAHWHPFKTLRRPLSGKIFFNVCFRPFLHSLDRIITINLEDTNYFESMSLPVTRIPHWCRTDNMPKMDSVDKSPDMILFVGRFNADNKGFNYLFSLPEGKYDIHCVGRGIVEKRSDMTFHTDIPVEELQSLYSKASLVVIPSKYEAFSYVALEAFSFFTPVVMSDRVRIADYLDGVSGFSVFPYGDHKAFIDAVEKTIGAKVDRQKIMSIFDPRRIKSLYKELFMNL